MRVDSGGAYANLVVPSLLADSDLDERDRRFVTELVYGTTRMRRACDWLIEPFLFRTVEPVVRAALRMGAYQLHMLGTPAHAAVGATVEVVPKRARGLVNAVLRRVSDLEPSWPDEATRLSYPDWIVDHLSADLGLAAALAALERMNETPPVTIRADGYVQDLASQWVVDVLGAGSGELVADLCAGPGGKATALAATGAKVVATDRRVSRARLVVEASEATGHRLPVATADGRCPPLRSGRFERVLVDAPCSGLGALRRRADARWRIDPDSIGRLVPIQLALVHAAADLLEPGGTLVYSVCTMTDAETRGIDQVVERDLPQLEPDPPGEPWQPWGRGAQLLPQDHDTDGMTVFRYRRRHG